MVLVQAHAQPAAPEGRFAGRRVSNILMWNPIVPPRELFDGSLVEVFTRESDNSSVAWILKTPEGYLLKLFMTPNSPNEGPFSTIDEAKFWCAMKI